MRTFLTILLAIHGAIHLMGFLKWWKLSPVSQLSGRTLLDLSPTGERVFGALWLTAMILLVCAAALRVAANGAWWMPAAGGVLLSQCLIVMSWHDAKFGTIANVLVGLPVVIAMAHGRFGARVDDEARALLGQASASGKPVVEGAEMAQLPGPVRKWLEASGTVGHSRIRTVRLKQRGEMRTSPDAAWMPATAEQYFSTEPPAFVWQIDATMFGFVPIAGRDKYVAGHGNMLITAGSLVKIVDVADEKIDLGSMLRFLGEMVWFPSAALSSSITWEPVDATSAKATMRYEGSVASAVFSFDEQGRFVHMRAERYLGGGADAKLTPWVVKCTDWRVFEGIQIPNRGDVGWILPTGEFSYYRWEILDVEYNRNTLYKDGPGLSPQAKVGALLPEKSP